ncbi:MAG: FIST N-terminal domain-containing protein [Chthoniobacterales bacterium]
MSARSLSLSMEGPFSQETVTYIASEIRSDFERPANIAFVFASGEYLSHIDEITETLRIDGHIMNVIFCSTESFICDAKEHESKSGFSLLVIAEPLGEKSIEMAFVSAENPESIYSVDLDAPRPLSFETFAHSKALGECLAFVDPHHFPTSDWLQTWGNYTLNAPVTGGLTASLSGYKNLGVFLNGRKMEGALLVRLYNKLKIVSVVSRGYRSLGEPLTVTRADNNIVYTLGARPAYEALESVFSSLSEKEKNLAGRNLLAGLALSEYIDDFKSGDFLSGNIIGADPHSGGVALGCFPRVGQTLQYQYLDPVTAENDLQKAFSEAAQLTESPLASLLFVCNCRGKKFFGQKNVDAGALVKHFGLHPTAGLFCDGEIGPIHGINSVSAHSAVAALIIETE